MFLLIVAIIHCALHTHLAFSNEATFKQNEKITSQAITSLLNSNPKTLNYKPSTSLDTQNQSLNTQSAELININTADIAMLKTLPYIGIKRAEAIIAYRNQLPHHRFQSLEELLKIKGISTKLLTRIQKYITI